MGDVYVDDEYQAEYLCYWCGGCREFTHIRDVVPVVKPHKGGRPMKNDASAETVKRRERRGRAKMRGGQTTQSLDAADGFVCCPSTIDRSLPPNYLVVCP